MKSLKICFTGLFVLSLLGGCGQLPGQPVAPQSPGTAAATVAFTATASRTPRPSTTPLPPPTRRATLVDPPTNTPIPTLKGLPSLTTIPTRAITLIPGFSIYIPPTPLPFRCAVAESYPGFNQVFKPRTDFIAKWKIYNVGSALWHIDDILFGYVSGEKMQNPDREDVFLPVTIYVGDKINVQVHMVPPKEPGTYTATWGLRKSNKRDPFCTFVVSIKVVKK